MDWSEPKKICLHFFEHDLITAHVPNERKAAQG
jgi:hypothetical protein